MKPLRKIIRRFTTDLEKTRQTCSLIGKNWIEPTDFSIEEYKSLFWTASEFKTISNEQYDNNLGIKSATFLLNEPNIHFQCSIQNASNFLRIPMKIIVDSKWETWQFPEDVGKVLSKTCDIIFLKSIFLSKAKSLASSASVPVVAVSNKRFANLRSLSDVFTLREHFGYLENLHVCWIGAPTSLINTYLLLMPKFGIKTKFYCSHSFGEKVSPISLSLAKKQGEIYSKNCMETSGSEEAISHSKILAIGADLGGLKQINDENCKGADHDFLVFHSMPRTKMEICPKLFESERNLTWASYKNYQWILAAFMVRALTDHKHLTKPLNFEEIKTSK